MLNGKAATLAPAAVSALNSVDFPALGNPTKPHENPMPLAYPLRGGRATAVYWPR